MGETVYKGPSIRFTDLKGLDQREEFGNKDLGVFSYLRGAVPNSKGILTKINGIRYCQNLGEQVLAIYQTNDSRRNIIIQTRSKIIIQSEAEFFGTTPYVPVLSPSELSDEDKAPHAILFHTMPAGQAPAGFMTPSNVWIQAPFDAAFATQTNFDGTAASFATVASNRVTLVPGVYRIRGWSLFNLTAVTNFGLAIRLYNITTAAPAWAGAPNEMSAVTVISNTTDENLLTELSGDLTVAVSTQLEMQGITQLSGTTFGKARNAAGSFVLPSETYRMLEFFKMS